MRSTLSDTDLSRRHKATVQRFYDVVFHQRRASAAVEFIDCLRAHKSCSLRSGKKV